MTSTTAVVSDTKEGELLARVATRPPCPFYGFVGMMGVFVDNHGNACGIAGDTVLARWKWTVRPRTGRNVHVSTTTRTSERSDTHSTAVKSSRKNCVRKTHLHGRESACAYGISGISSLCVTRLLSLCFTSTRSLATRALFLYRA